LLAIERFFRERIGRAAACDAEPNVKGPKK